MSHHYPHLVPQYPFQTRLYQIHSMWEDFCMLPHTHTNKILCILAWSSCKLQCDIQRSCRCSGWTAVCLEVQEVYQMVLCMKVGYPDGQAPSHTLLVPYLVVPIQVLLFISRLADGICEHFQWMPHWCVEGNRVSLMMYHSSLFLNTTFWPYIPWMNTTLLSCHMQHIRT